MRSASRKALKPDSYRHRAIARLLIAVIVSFGSLWHSTAKADFLPSTASAGTLEQPCRPTAAAQAKQSETITQAATLTPFLDIVPDSNGTDVLISAGGV